ncbi:hypothetical protein HK405_015836, partial [Cladochytrium tenue]
PRLNPSIHRHAADANAVAAGQVFEMQTAQLPLRSAPLLTLLRLHPPHLPPPRPFTAHPTLARPSFGAHMLHASAAASSAPSRGPSGPRSSSRLSSSRKSGFKSGSRGGIRMPTSSANWTFATRYPRAPPSAAAARSGKKGTKNGGVPKHNLQAPKAANRRRGAGAPAVRGLVLPPRMRLDSFPPGRSAAGAPKQSVRPPKPPARRLSPAELLAQAENTEKQRRWKEKMAQHDAKFAMHDLGRASAAAEAARRVAADRIRANRDFFSMTAAGEDGGGGLDAGREAGLDGGLAPPPETAAHRESSSSAHGESATTAPLLRKDVLNSICAYLGSVRPVATPVQALAIPASLSPDRDGRALVVGAETGSGKTLAYLVPIIQRLKAAEDDEARRLLPVENVVDAVAGHMALTESTGTDQPVDLGATEVAVKALAASGLRRLRRPRAIVL